jgi:hypothetical protein
MIYYIFQTRQNLKDKKNWSKRDLFMSTQYYMTIIYLNLAIKPFF